MEPKYRLNRSLDEYSAGTVVVIVDVSSDDKNMVTVTPAGVLDDEYIEVPMEYLTKCRNATDMISRPTREERRVGQARKEIQT